MVQKMKNIDPNTPIITVKWVRSTIGRPGIQKKIIKAMGFKRLYQTLVLPNRPEIRGMINHVRHLVEVLQ
ncbi:MAG: 50S ribosomal protein L30 [Thermodesulfobacteriota bacterium]